MLLSFGINPFLCSKEVAFLARTHRLCHAARNYTTSIHDLAIRHVPRIVASQDWTNLCATAVTLSVRFCDEWDFTAYYIRAKERLGTTPSLAWFLSQSKSATVDRVYAMTQSIPHSMLRKELQTWSLVNPFHPWTHLLYPCLETHNIQNAE